MMKPEEIKKAVRGLKNIVEFWCNRPEEIETAKLAIEALEKQIPKKPEVEGKQGYMCQCASYVGYLHEYCHECGQKIDWEE